MIYACKSWPSNIKITARCRQKDAILHLKKQHPNRLPPSSFSRVKEITGWPTEMDGQNYHGERIAGCLRKEATIIGIRRQGRKKNIDPIKTWKTRGLQRRRFLLLLTGCNNRCLVRILCGNSPFHKDDRVLFSRKGWRHQARRRPVIGSIKEWKKNVTASIIRPIKIRLCAQTKLNR